MGGDASLGVDSTGTHRRERRRGPQLQGAAKEALSVDVRGSTRKRESAAPAAASEETKAGAGADSAPAGAPAARSSAAEAAGALRKPSFLRRAVGFLASPSSSTSRLKYFEKQNSMRGDGLLPNSGVAVPGGTIAGSAKGDVEAMRAKLKGSGGSARWGKLKSDGLDAAMGSARGMVGLTAMATAAAKREARLARNMRLWRGLSRTVGVLMAIRKAQIFRQKMFGRVNQERLAMEEERLALLADEMERDSKRGYCARKLHEWDPDKHLVLTPKDKLKQAWDVVFLVSLFWVTYRVPFVVAFDPPAVQNGAYYMDQVAEIAFYIDVLLGFFTVYTDDDGRDATSVKRISLNYLKTWFALDFIAAFPFDQWELDGTEGTLLRSTKLLRLMRLAKVEAVEKRLVVAADLGEKGQSRIKLAKLTFYVFCAAHISACVWYYITVLDGPDNPNSWTQLYPVDTDDTSAMYMSALYYAVATLTTVGYGDVSAHTNLERVFAMFLIIMGAGLFGLIVGKMSKLSESMGVKIQEYRRRQTAANQFLKSKRVPKRLRRRTFEYYEYVLRNAAFMEERSIMEDLSPSLRRELTFLLHKDVLADVPVLSFGSHGFQAVVVEMLEPTLVLEGEYVLIAGDASQEMYFVQVGTVAFVDNRGFTFRELETGSFFGEESVLDGTRSEVSVRAVTNCEMLGLSRTNLAALLQDFPEFESTLRAAATMRASHAGNKLANSAGLVNKMVRRARKARQNIGTSMSEGVLEGMDGESMSGDDDDIDDALRASLPRCNTPPLELQSWGQLNYQMKDMEKAYCKAVGNSRTLQAERFDPQPVDASGMRLPSTLHAVAESLAKHLHEKWCVARLEAGWKWGRQSNEATKTSPELVPWAEVSEATRSINKVSAELKVQTILALGYLIHAPDDPLSEDESGSIGGGPSVGNRSRAPSSTAESVTGDASDLGSIRSFGLPSRGPRRTSSGSISHTAARGGAGLDVATPDAATSYSHKRAKTTYIRNIGGSMREIIFTPRPLRISKTAVDHSSATASLVSSLALQEHLEWARSKKDAGYTWATHDDAAAKKARDLVPWSLLEPSKKELLTANARGLVGALLALDCRISLSSRAEAASKSEDGADSKQVPAAFGAASDMLSPASRVGSTPHGGRGSPGAGAMGGSQFSPVSSRQVFSRLDNLDANMAKVMSLLEGLRRSVQSLPSGDR